MLQHNFTDPGAPGYIAAADARTAEQQQSTQIDLNTSAIAALQSSTGLSKYFNLSAATWNVAKIGDPQTGITNCAKIIINGSVQKEMVNFPTDGTTRRGVIQLINQGVSPDDEVIINDINLPFYHQPGAITRCTWEYDGTRLFIDSEADPNVQNMPVFDQQPTSVELVEGEEHPVAFQCSVRNYQSLDWLKDGTPIAKKGSNLLIQSPTADDIADYCLEVTGYNSKKYHSNSVYLLIRSRILPVITTDTVSSLSVNAGGNITFSVTYTGYPQPAIQLLQSATEDGVYIPIDGATTTPFTRAWVNTSYTKWQVGTGDTAAYSTPRLVTAIKGTQTATPAVVVKDTENYLVMLPVSGTLITALEGSLDITVPNPTTLPLTPITLSGTAYWGIAVGDINLAAGKAGLRYKQTDTLNAGEWGVNESGFTASYMVLEEKSFSTTIDDWLVYQSTGSATVVGGHVKIDNGEDLGICAVYKNDIFIPGDTVKVTITGNYESGFSGNLRLGSSLGSEDSGTKSIPIVFTSGICIIEHDTTALRNGEVNVQCTSYHTIMNIDSLKIEKQNS